MILRALCKQNETEIIEEAPCVDPIHMLIAIPTKYSISQSIGFLKEKQPDDIR